MTSPTPPNSRYSDLAAQQAASSPQGAGSRTGEKVDEIVAAKRPDVVSLVAVVIGILALPISLVPIIGVVVTTVSTAACLVIFILALRAKRPRKFAVTGLVLSILALVASIFFTVATLEVVKQCEGFEGDLYYQCIEDLAK